MPIAVHLVEMDVDHATRWETLPRPRHPADLELRLAQPFAADPPRVDIAALQAHLVPGQRAAARQQERRLGKECVSPCSSRCSQYHYKQHNTLVSLLLLHYLATT